MSSMSLALTSLFDAHCPVPTITRSPRLPKRSEYIEHGIAAGHVRRDDVQLDVELYLTILANQPLFCRPWLLASESKTSTVISEPSYLGVGTVAAAAAGRERQQRSSRNASRNGQDGDFLGCYPETSLYSFF